MPDRPAPSGRPAEIVTANGPGATAGPSEPDVTGSLWRGLAVVRFAMLAHAVVVDAVHWDGYRYELQAWLVVSGIAVWTLVVTWAYDDPRRRGLPILTADVLVAIGALVAGRFVLGDQLLADGATLSAFWVAAPALACAIRYGWVAGVASGSVIAVADLATRTHVTNESIENLFLLLLASAGLGYWGTLVRRAAVERARAAELAARTEERERLARAVHDGVLQVLAYVQRRGSELGGEAAELARAAGQQERALRALVQGLPNGTTTPTSTQTPSSARRPGSTSPSWRLPDERGTKDVASLIRELPSLLAAQITDADLEVSVAAPAEPVRLTAHAALELVAAVRAALDNVAMHAPGHQAYLLVEDEGDAVVVSVRDDGPGFAEGRLAEAEAAGRMGVSRSIVGRLRDLGGSATLTAAPGRGTEWELRVPRSPRAD